MELQEPEIESLDIDDDGEITANLHIARNCAECGTTLKEATLELEGTPKEFADHDHRLENGGHGFYAEEKSIETIEEIRRKKSYFGARIVVEVSCSCNEGVKYDLTLEKEIAASDMDEAA